MGHTPYLRVDVAVLEANIAAMAAHAAASGLTLRPHAKTHKSTEIAARQLAAGADGLTVATIGEAEVLADVCSDLFIAYPLWVDAEDGHRLRRLVDRGTKLQVGCDSFAAGTNLAGLPVEVLIEVDSGHHRTGVRPEQAGALAAELVGIGLSVAGVFTFPGHSYSPTSTRRAAADEAAALTRAADSFGPTGLACDRRSGGSTPSAGFTTGAALTELRPGVYVFGDAQQVELGTIGFDQVALTVISQVVSHAGGQVVCDAGSKALGADRAAWATGYGRVLDVPEARIVALSEHHATIDWPGRLPALGSTIAVVPNHACNAVNLAEEYVLSSGGTWTVDARGRNH
jgi:D-serine deaminase-like pyridoxal phosphate-dependent protein